jgi:aspartate/methionine/tyrosine aminotransferase
MPIELFEMERMQSTWENLVDYDMSESGVRPLTLRELVGMGFDLEAFLDEPLGYSQSNGTIELRERIAALYPGADADRIEVTNGTSEANYLVALSQLRPGDEFAMQVPNYMQMPGVARSLGAAVRTFALRQETGWEPDWDEFEQAMTSKTRLVYLSNPNNPTGAVLSDVAMQHIVSRVESAGSWLLSDEVYLGAEIDRPRTRSFWGMSDRVIVTSGLSKAYGIPGVRIGWIVAPKQLTAECWTQHDYLTIGPNKMSDRIARVAVEERNRETCYARTRSILAHNLPIARMDRGVQPPPHLARTTGGGNRAGPV